MMLNKNLQEINIQNMDTELVAQMFKNYQSNVLFHLEGMHARYKQLQVVHLTLSESYKWIERSGLSTWAWNGALIAVRGCADMRQVCRLDSGSRRTVDRVDVIPMEQYDELNRTEEEVSFHIMQSIVSMNRERCADHPMYALAGTASWECTVCDTNIATRALVVQRRQPTNDMI